MANELGQIAKAASGMNAATNQFRAAADEHNENMSRILKDVYSLFASQKQQIAGIGPQLQDVISGSQQEVANRINQTNSLLSQSIQIQMYMLNSLNNLSRSLSSGSGNSGGNSGLGLLASLGKAGKMAAAAATASVAAVVGSGGSSQRQQAERILSSGEQFESRNRQRPSLEQLSGIKPADQNGNSSEAMQFFQTQGWSKAQSAGIVGNLQQESDNFSSDVISGKRRGDGGQAVGIAQWHPDRQALFEQHFGKKLEQASFKEQLAFVHWELTNTEKRAGDALLSAKDAITAASIIDSQYERSKGTEIKQRAANAVALAGKDAEPQTATNNQLPKVSQPPISSNVAERQQQLSGGAPVTQPQNTAVPATPEVTPTGGPNATPIAGGNNPESGGQATAASAVMGDDRRGYGGGEDMGGQQGGNGRLSDAELMSIGEGNHRLAPAAAHAYKQMFDAARQEGISWSITDSYRPYAQQVAVARQKGLYSQGGLAAYPGTSNHGWGLALDLGGGAHQANSRENQWLQQNAGRFGFHGIGGEPWHWEFGGGASAGMGERMSGAHMFNQRGGMDMGGGSFGFGSEQGGGFGFNDRGGMGMGGGPFPELGNVGKIGRGEIGHGVLGTAGFVQSGPMGMMDSVFGGRGGGMLGAGINILSSLLGGGNNEESGYPISNRHQRGEGLARRGSEQSAADELAREMSMRQGRNQELREPDTYRQAPPKSASGMDRNTEKFFGNEFAPSWYAELKGAYPHDLKHVKF